MLPIDPPGKIVCIGLNYADHVAETGRPAPEEPVLFAKWSNTLIGPGDPIVMPTVTDQVDYEAELGVVIGARVRNVSKENALEAVRGYICVNDVSARDIQWNNGGQFCRGKSPDSFCPVGPKLVPASEISDPQALAIRTILNGEVVQDGTTADMVFKVDELIEFITRTMTLEPGDLIATGTPSGVGAFKQPPVWMKPGDEITVEIERVGRLTNPIVAAP
jgi:2-keto-4-pentenoate hydratase/2-oxohepta-3-ene-1,7-dioic acid hydratase in catechol pathway